MADRVKIICDNKIPFLKGVLEPFADVTYLPPSEINNNTVKDTDALLIRTRTKCTASLLDGTKVKFIGTATIGYDHIDTKYCDAKNIKWVNAPGCNSFSVMQYMASALIALAGKKNLKLYEKTIGIVGVGNVGTKIARLAKIFGINVLLNDPPRQRLERDSMFVDFDTLISKSDIITFHVPLIRDGIDKTFHLADEKFFEKLNTQKIIINTSRGEVINTTALKNAIKNEFVNGCILDVWENEPSIDTELLEMVDISTPHIAGYSADGKANGTSVVVKAVSSFFNFRIDPNWYPKELPQPKSNPSLVLDCRSKSPEENLFEAILHTYDVLDDDNTLRNSVDTFEKQRGNYPVRREFPFYSIKTSECDKLLLEKLTNLRFNLIAE